MMIYLVTTISYVESSFIHPSIHSFIHHHTTGTVLVCIVHCKPQQGDAASRTFYNRSPTFRTRPAGALNEQGRCEVLLDVLTLLGGHRAQLARVDRRQALHTMTPAEECHSVSWPCRNHNNPPTCCVHWQYHAKERCTWCKMQTGTPDTVQTTHHPTNR